MAWSPFAGGQLFNINEPVNQRLTAYLQREGARLGLTSEELDVLILAWLLRHPAGILPVLGTTSSARLKQSLKALEIQLSIEDWYAILTAIRGHEIP